MPFKTPSITSKFIRRHLREVPLLQEIEEYAEINNLPILLPESAAFLAQLISLKNPQRVLETGMGIGYSGHIILLGSSARLFTVEIACDKIEAARGFFTKNGLIDRVTVFKGDECEIIPKLPQILGAGEAECGFDFIFLDGAKTRYVQHLPYLKQLLSSGGVLLADNVLFEGFVSGENEFPSNRSTIVEGLRAYLKAVCSDKDFATSILPVGDGMTLSLKK